jgi:NADPH-dependent curcumin reductase CurA
LAGPPGQDRKGSGDFLKAGKPKDKEVVVKGIDKTIAAFIGLFQEQNAGKMVVELARARASTVFL